MDTIDIRAVASVQSEPWRSGGDELAVTSLEPPKLAVLVTVEPLNARIND